MTTEREADRTGLLPGMPELQAVDPDLPARLRAELDEAEEKAWDLAGPIQVPAVRLLVCHLGASEPRGRFRQTEPLARAGADRKRARPVQVKRVEGVPCT